MGDFVNFISEWLNSGVYTFFTDAVAYWIEAAVILYFKKMALMIPFAWGVAKTILQDLNLSSHITTAWSSLPSDVTSILSFFNIPEFLNTVISGFATRLVLGFMGVK